MPDYSKGSVSFFETKIFQDWVKSKGYAWPPVDLYGREDLFHEFHRELMTTHSDAGSPP